MGHAEHPTHRRGNRPLSKYGSVGAALGQCHGILKRTLDAREIVGPRRGIREVWAIGCDPGIEYRLDNLLVLLTVTAAGFDPLCEGRITLA